MARSRLELQALLERIMSEFADDGKKRVWFEPQSSVYLSYPCIVYKLESKDHLLANNGKYRTMGKYSVTVIDPDVESMLPDRIEELPYCRFDRSFAVDALEHTIFTLYY